MQIKHIITMTVAGLFAATSLTGCSSATGPTSTNELTIVTHDSAVFTEELLAEFKAETGITVTQVKAGDAGEMTNKLVLTKDAPIGDLVYGIDNTFAPAAIEAEIFDTTGDYADNPLREIDYADVCLNYDKAWFADQGLTPPTKLADLTKPEYKGLTVLTNPSTSSPGLAFLTATVATFGEAGWEQYWSDLQANKVKIASGWEDAYFTDFSGSSGQGAYPIVLSYSSSPAFEVRDNGQSQTASIMDGCFRQWEYAAVLKGAKNVVGAQKFIDFMLGQSFQTALPDSMYVYPVTEGIALPEAWAQFAPAATNTVGGDLNIAANRVTWLEKWSSIFSNN